MSTMKDSLPIDRGVSTETYHGTRMNRKALDFHTQLHEWSEAQNLVSKHTQLLTASQNQDMYLPVKKLAHIEYWARQVNKYYLPLKHSRPRSGSFMKIDVSKYNIKPDKGTELKRSKSAFYPQRLPLSDIHSRPTTSGRKRFFGTDLNSVKNNIAESQMHYSAQRQDLYSAKSRRSKRSAKTDDLKTEPIDLAVSEITEFANFDDSTESVTVTPLADGVKVTEDETQNHIDSDVLQPHIVTRSWSNRMLNVISIDDCKLTCRYRPQIIKESRKLPDDLKEVPTSRSAKQQSQKKVTIISKTGQQEVLVADMDKTNGNEADDEADNSTDSVNDVENDLNELTVNEAHVDTNNNSDANSCHISKPTKEANSDRSGDLENGGIYGAGPTHSGSSTDQSNGSQSKCARIQFKEQNNQHRSTGTPEVGVNFSSRGTSKTSYGRVTNLCTNTDSSNSKNRRKKISRTSRINHAINDVVKDRKVMNSLERDFDTRTAEFGRTVVDTTDGSETFKKIHANLRKKIDKLMDTHCALHTREYFEKVRKNSVASSS